MTAVEEDNVEKATFSADGKRVLVVDVDGNRYKLDALPNDPTLLDTLTKHKVDVTVLPPQQTAAAGGGSLVSSLLFPALLFGGLFLLSQRNQDGGGMPGGMGGPGNPMQLGQSQAKVQMQPDTGVTFADVVGVDGAKIELEEVVQFLKEQDRFTQLGARIPRGLILEGPPGTGKTLLARAVAGEAGVPFFSVSGSEFVEMFVGVGASRVRDLFAQAKKNAPCIIFIDEIDAVGRQRGGGQGGGNDEREQTLNQILTEMDGFEGNPGIIVIAATNRADVLDSALLRPGRFDRRIMVENPDFKGRVAILGVHSRGKPLEDDVDLEQIARRTPGFSGAMLANLMNEAAIFAARKDKVKIGNEQISDALDRVTLGPEKKNAEISLQKRELVAYHEAGHAVVGALIPDYDQVAKITITPRGNAGGLTFFAPNEDRTDSGLYSRQYLESRMAVALGGRIAEEIIFGEDEITTGASNDLQQVSQTAKRMVMEFGMSEKLGQVALSGGNGQQQQMSAETKALIDAEVSRLVQGAYTRAKQLLLDNRQALDKLATMLVEKETVTAEEFAQILNDSTVSVADYTVYA
jgi:cell division protease FtsH